MSTITAFNSSSTSGALISQQNVAVGYNGTILFEHVSLPLFAGQLVCLLGPNGAGKSTLVRTLAGLQSPLAGEINVTRVGGTRLFENIAVVLTDPIPAGEMTAREVITLGRYPFLKWTLKLLPGDLAMIDQAIALVNLASFADKPLRELSDGQRQMVMVARALAQNTPVILLDEPTAYLDLNNSVGIMRFLRNLARTSGKAILVATHELDLAVQTADLLWVARNDKTISTGVPEDLILNGTLDSVFEFKGYDLKTGQVNHDAYRGITVHLVGEGYEYRWTKGALERSGFSVSDCEGEKIIIVQGNPPGWKIRGETIHSLAGLLEILTTLPAAL